MIFGDILKGLFGDKGLTGGVMDVLKTTGVLKDPEMSLKVEQSLRDFETTKGSQEIELEKISAADRDSARKREIEVKDKTPAIIAFASFLGFFGILTVLIFKDIPASANNALMIMLGVLGGIVTSITAYYYGSSSGSSKKNDTIERFMNK